MTQISDSLRLLIESQVEADDDRYVVSLPKEVVENSSLSVDDIYRVALLPSAVDTTQPDSDHGISRNEPTDERPTSPPDTRSPEPPVEEGEVRSVTIDTLGDQGDGLAKVERGFIVIVPETQPGEQVEVEITTVNQTVAFGEPISGSRIN
jgi:predicted RNA-binding protein with TRAM domain